MDPQAVNPYAAPKARVDEAQAAEQAPALWNPESGGALCLLLSVVFGSWIVWQNWKAIGDEQRVSASRIWFFVSLTVLALMILLPGGRLLAFGYLILWYFAENRPQIRYVKEHYGGDYPRKPWLKVIAVGFVAILAYVFAVSILIALVFARHR